MLLLFFKRLLDILAFKVQFSEIQFMTQQALSSWIKGRQMNLIIYVSKTYPFIVSTVISKR